MEPEGTRQLSRKHLAETDLGGVAGQKESRGYLSKGPSYVPFPGTPDPLGQTPFFPSTELEGQKQGRQLYPSELAVGKGFTLTNDYNIGQGLGNAPKFVLWEDRSKSH